MNAQGMPPEYLSALEKQISWLKWSRSPMGDVMWKQEGLVEGRRLYEQVLESGTCFYVTRPFCELVDHARARAPVTLTFDPTWMFAQTGFVWLDSPFVMPKIRAKSAPGNFRLVAQAIGWSKVAPNAKATNDVPVGQDAYQFVVFQVGGSIAVVDEAGTRLMNTPSVQGFLPLSYFHLARGQDIASRVIEFERAALVQDAAEYDDADRWRHEIQYAMTLLHLMAQRVAIVGKEPLNRPAKRAFEREGRTPPEHVRPILLRRLEERNRSTGDPQSVDWQWQWDVVGHWRRFPYHPGCAACESRGLGCGAHAPIWVSDYVKGPPDKPFKADQRRLFIAGR